MTPAIASEPSGSVRLTSQQADHFYNYNGRGYYEKPSVYKLEWHFTAKPGRYAVPQIAGAEIAIDGRKATPVTEVGAGEVHSLTLTPPNPFVKGDRLPESIGQVELKPQP